MAGDATNESGKVPLTPALKQAAVNSAKDRAANSRWDLNIAIFLFAVLIIVIILLFQEVGIEIVAPVALFGLLMVWLVGWRRGKQLYNRFYEEELDKLDQVMKNAIGDAVIESLGETIEDRVQQALRDRWSKPGPS